MKFPSIRKQTGYTVTVPQLNGGLNISVPAHLIEDNQLSDVKNMWYKDGMLQTRPGARFMDAETGFWSSDTCRHVQCVGDKILIYNFGEAPGGHFFSVMMMDKDCRLIKESAKRREEKQSVKSILAFPISADANEEFADCEALLFVKYDTGACLSFGYGMSVLREVNIHEPTVLINGYPVSVDNGSVEGDRPETYNLLTSRFKCRYSTNGEGARYNLPDLDLDPDAMYEAIYTDNNGTEHRHYADTKRTETVIEEDGTSTDGYKLVVDVQQGFFKFCQGDDDTGVVLPITAFTNNITIRASKKEYKNFIKDMTIATYFGGSASGLSSGTRLFVSGNEERPNLVCWSALNNPTYFPENNYAYVGTDSQRVTAFGKQSDMLVIFKENEMYCTKYVQGSVDVDDVTQDAVMDIDSAVAVFPLVQLHPTIGCDCPDTVCLCNNRLVWLNSDGRVYGLFSAGQYSERNVRELSRCIYPELRNREKDLLQGASAAELDDYYLLMVGSTVYVMDYSSYGFSHYSSYTSDDKAQKAITWYVWDLSNIGVFYRGTQYGFRTEPKLIQIGEKPVIIAESPIGGKISLLFTHGEKDSCIRKDNTVKEKYTVYDKAIPCSFTTKLYDFGRPDLKKSIQQLYLSVRDDAGSEIRVSYLTDRCLEEDAFTLNGEGESGNGYVRTWRLTPNINLAQAFGIRCDSDHGMAAQGIMLKYKHQGVVR